MTEVKYEQRRSVKFLERELKSQKYENIRLKRELRNEKDSNTILKHQVSQLRKVNVTPVAHVDEVCKHLSDMINHRYEVDINYISRKAEVVRGRIMYYAYLRENTHLSLNEIGATLLTEHHHSTILHALRNHNDWISMKDKWYINEWNWLNRMMKSMYVETEPIINAS